MQQVWPKLIGMLCGMIVVSSCSDNLPKEKIHNFPIEVKVEDTGDSLKLTYCHPVAMPVLFYVHTNFADPNGTYTAQNPIHVKGYDTLRLSFPKPSLSAKLKDYFSPRLVTEIMKP